MIKITKELLIKYLVIEDNEITKLAKLWQCTRYKIYYYCRKYKIPLNRRKELKINDRYGILTIIKEADSKYYSIRYLCKCDCGKEKIILATRLRSGESKSCGCKSWMIREGHPAWKGYKEIGGSFWHHLNKNAQSRCYEVKITIEYIRDLLVKQNFKCALTKETIGFGKRSNDRYTASLDRIDNNKGYIEGNVWWVHKDVNLMKQGFSVERLVDLSKKISKYKN